MVGREKHLTAKRYGDRQLEALGKLCELLDSLSTPACTTQDRNRCFCLGQAFGQRSYLTGSGCGVDGDVVWRIGHSGHLDQHILGQGNDHRTWTSRGRDMEGARQDLGDPRRIVNLGGPFGGLSKDRAVVHFLKSFTLAHATFNLSDKDNHRSRVLFGDVDTGQGIRGTRPACDHANTGCAREFAIGVSHHGGTAFLTAHGDLDADIHQGVEYGEKAFARYAKNVLDAMADELTDENLTTGARLAGGRCLAHFSCLLFREKG